MPGLSKSNHQSLPFFPFPFPPPPPGRGREGEERTEVNRNEAEEGHVKNRAMERATDKGTREKRDG